MYLFTKSTSKVMAQKQIFTGTWIFGRNQFFGQHVFWGAFSLRKVPSVTKNESLAIISTAIHQSDYQFTNKHFFRTFYLVIFAFVGHFI
jgi:hypothetical protein